MSNASLEKGGGDVTGPGAGASTDERLARWDGTTGTLLQDSNVQVTDAGQMTNTLQPCFNALKTANALDQTGAGTVVAVEFNGIAFDQGSDYDSVDTFTAPVSGRYSFYSLVTITGITSLMTNGQFRLVTSNRSYFHVPGAPSKMFTINTTIAVPMSTAVTDMDPADICRIDIIVSNGAADSVIVVGGPASTSQTIFCGCLIC